MLFHFFNALEGREEYSNSVLHGYLNLNTPESLDLRRWNGLAEAPARRHGLAIAIPAFTILEVNGETRFRSSKTIWFWNTQSNLSELMRINCLRPLLPSGFWNISQPSFVGSLNLRSPVLSFGSQTLALADGRLVPKSANAPRKRTPRSCIGLQLIRGYSVFIMKKLQH
jgi:hypothetical protein